MRRTNRRPYGPRARPRRLWVYVEDEARWVPPLTRAARTFGQRILSVDPSSASPGPWEEYPERLLDLVRERLRAARTDWSQVRGVILDIYYPASPEMPARALARHGRFVPGGILLARDLVPVLPKRTPIVFYSSKAHEELRPRALHRLLKAPGRYYLLKLRGGAEAAARWLAILDRSRRDGPRAAPGPAVSARPSREPRHRR